MILRLRWLTDQEDGATAVEYGLLVALIALAISGAVAALGGSLDGVFGNETLIEYLTQ